MTDESGAQVARVEDPECHREKELARVTLPAGRYVIEIDVRRCEAPCPALDGQTDGCEPSVDVVAAGIIAVEWNGASAAPARPQSPARNAG